MLLQNAQIRARDKSAKVQNRIEFYLRTIMNGRQVSKYSAEEYSLWDP
jgi:hypothetical protein